MHLLHDDLQRATTSRFVFLMSPTTPTPLTKGQKIRGRRVEVKHEKEEEENHSQSFMVLFPQLTRTYICIA